MVVVVVVVLVVVVLVHTPKRRASMFYDVLLLREDQSYDWRVSNVPPCDSGTWWVWKLP